MFSLPNGVFGKLYAVAVVGSIRILLNNTYTLYVQNGEESKRKVIVVSMSPQSRASIAAAYRLTAEQVRN